MAEIKTKPTNLSVKEFIESISEDQKREDSQKILSMIQSAIKDKPKIWGAGLIGFGDVRLKSPATGREVDWFKIGFSPRKANISIYLPGGMESRKKELGKLGKHKTGVGCLYINKLADIDINVLNDIIIKSLS